MNKKKFATRLTALSIAASLAIPAATVGILSSHEAGYTTHETSSQIMHRAAQDRRRLRIQRRKYWQAMEKYQKLLREGVAVRKPDFNDVDSIDAFLEGDWETMVAEEEEVEDSGAAFSEAVPTESTEELKTKLSSADRRILRSYVRARACPESMKNNLLEGFYELCLSMVGANVKTTLPVGRLNEKAQRVARHRAPPASMKLRRQMIDMAYDRSNRRSEGVRPGRPSKYKGLLAD